MRAKKMAVTMAAMAAMTATAVPAYAQEDAAPNAQLQAAAQEAVAGSAQYAMPSAAQGEEVSVTGVLIDSLPADIGAVGTHSITDEATGTTYALRSAGADLDSYSGQRVTVHGALTPGEEGSGEGGISGSGSLPSIDVTRVEPAGEVGQPGPAVKLTGTIERLPSDGGPPVFGITDEATGERYILDAGEGADYGLYEGHRVSVEGIPRTDPNTGFNFLQVAVIRPLDGPLGNDEITATFDLAAECAPPAGTTFYGLVGQQPAQLTDPDGDGTYEGNLDLTADFGTFPIPVSIISGDPAHPQGVIKDFGKVVLKDGDAFSAGASFCDGGTGGGTTGGGTDNGNGGSGNGVAVVSGGSGNTDKGSSGSASAAANASGGGGGAVQSSSASPAASGSTTGGVVSSAAKVLPSSVANVLPSTGGILPIAGLGGLVLIVGGLLVRKIFR